MKCHDLSRNPAKVSGDYATDGTRNVIDDQIFIHNYMCSIREIC